MASEALSQPSKLAMALLPTSSFPAFSLPPLHMGADRVLQDMGYSGLLLRLEQPSWWAVCGSEGTSDMVFSLF